MLLRMYSRWAERRGFGVEVDEATEGQEAGLLSATFIVKGRFAYGLLSAERGVHRLVRMCPFDSQHRRQTSFASLDVTPFLEDLADEVEIDEKDLRIDTYRVVGRRRPARQQDRLGGPPHPPAHRHRGRRCQNERSQHQNKARAMQILAAKLAERARAERQAEMDALSGDRGRQRLGQPDPQLRAWRRTSWSRTCAPTSRPATSTRCSTATSTRSWRPSCAVGARRSAEQSLQPLSCGGPVRHRWRWPRARVDWHAQRGR